MLEHFENYFKESVWNEFYELVGDKYIKGELKKLQARMKETSQWNQPPKPKEAEDQKKSAKDSEEKSKKEEKKDTKAQKKAEKKAEKAEKKAEKKSHKNEGQEGNKDKKKKKQKDFIPAETG